MNKIGHYRNIFILAFALLLLPAAHTVFSQESDEDLVARGEYLVNAAGCVTCHTPPLEQYLDFENFTPEDLQTVAMFDKSTLDLENGLLSGGRLFDLGPAGAYLSRNLTPDEETGIGSWTDEEIETAIRTGATPDGRYLHPIMPTHLFNNMADADMDAIIAYLRSIPAVDHEIPPPNLEVPPYELPFPAEEIVAPDPEDEEAYGGYLVMGVLPCTDCHTPIDPTTGAPMFDLFLAGGQPYEGPWGIVYGGNITPDDETGIGTWTREEIERAITAGVRPDGRRLILMPWQDYAGLSDQDTQALLTFLESLPPIDNEVPAASVEPLFQVFVEE